MKKMLYVMLLGLACTLLFAACSKEFSAEFTVQQVTDEQMISISWTEENITKLEVTLMQGDTTVTSKTFEQNALSGKKVELEALKGKYKVVIKATNSKDQVCNVTKEIEINVAEFAADFTVQQIDDAQKIAITWENDTVKEVKVTVKHGDSTVISKTFGDADISGKKIELDAYYGKHSVIINAVNTEHAFCNETKEVAVSTDEYIIAPISGSMPQLYFTLNMKEITNDYSIPAFVWLARPGSWNWDNLPDNVFAMPNVDKSEVLIHNNYDRMVEATNDYIKELYAINNNAKFNLYINDYNTYLYLKLLVANGIPEDNYYVTLLSDGGASYAAFNEAFNSDDPNFDADAKYDQMVADLNTLYDEVKQKGDYNWTDTFVISTSKLNQYPYVIAREKNNVEWWVLRPRSGVLCSPDEEFINRVLNDDKTEGIIEERNFAKPLTTMTEEEKTALKNLYNFNNELFEAADQSGKKAMMILGSWAKPENEPDFEAYVRFVKAYYGDEFVYYYKGHPNTPTSNYPDKQAQLEKLGLIDVESSINAELILFFYPDIYMCGYDSSTFMSVQKPEMACAMFNMRKDAEAMDNKEYKDLLGIYVSKIDIGKFEYPALCAPAGQSYFLLEYNNMGEDFEADFGIYNDTLGTITNYKLVDGVPTKV